MPEPFMPEVRGGSKPHRKRYPFQGKTHREHWAPMLPKNAARILQALTRRVGRKMNGRVEAGALAKSTGLSDRCVRGHLNEMEHLGVFTRTRIREGGYALDYHYFLYAPGAAPRRPGGVRWGCGEVTQTTAAAFKAALESVRKRTKSYRQICRRMWDSYSIGKLVEAFREALPDEERPPPGEACWFDPVSARGVAL